MNLYDKLQAFTNEEHIPFHMPGHKRNTCFSMSNPYEWDITEIEGTDNLHHPDGILQEEMERLRRHYHTKDTFLLVNGSTCGILAAIASCCQRGDSILVARNCHRSVYHAMFLLELEPVYIYPKSDNESGILLEISPKQVSQVLKQKNVSCVIITSPTYEGIVSDIGGIAEVCHSHDVPLIVDEAHGAHFAWGKQFPQTAMEQGADLVIESLHKTLPALTQTALLHRTSDHVSPELLMQYLAIFETSSPSYVLMSSISQCISWLENLPEKAWDIYSERLIAFVSSSRKWKHLKLWRPDNQEISKLIIGTWNTNITGVQLAQRLRTEYHIDVEMEAPEYILAMTSIADVDEAMTALTNALSEIDRSLNSSDTPSSKAAMPPKAHVCMNSYEASYQPHRFLPLESCLGCISGEFAFIYPPGIPFLVPGEEITDPIIHYIKQASKYGLTVLGLKDKNNKNILVLPKKDK